MIESQILFTQKQARSLMWLERKVAQLQETVDSYESNLVFEQMQMLEEVKIDDEAVEDLKSKMTKHEEMTKLEVVQ